MNPPTEEKTMEWEKELRLGLDELFEDLQSYTGPNIDENFTRTYEYTKSFIKALVTNSQEK
jgi:hypothetical protein